MRKCLLLFVLALVVCSFGIAAAQDGVDVTALARYFPEDAPLFFSFRIDYEYIESLDSIIERATSALGGMMPMQEVSIRQALDMFAQSSPIGEDFSTTFGPWLGSSVAIGFPSIKDVNIRQGGVSGSSGSIVAFDVIDRDEALEFAQMAFFANSEFEESEVGNFTVYTAVDQPESQSQSLALSDDTLLVLMNTPFEVVPEPEDDTLLDGETFNAAYGSLPAQGGYNVFFYVDVPAIVDALISEMPSPANLGPSELLISSLGAQAIGLTIDDSTLIADFAGTETEDSLPIALTPTDYEFTALLPADISLLIQGKDLHQVYDSVVEAVRGVYTQFDQPTDDLDRSLSQIAVAVRGLTGLDFEDEFLAALEGNYAAFISYTPVEPGAPSTITSMFYPDETIDINFGFGLLIEAVDSENASALADAIGELVEEQAPDNVIVSTDEIGATEVTVLSVETPENFATSLDIVIGANEAALVIATRPQAEMILTGAEGLQASENFADAAAYVLPEPTLVAYVSDTGMALLADIALGYVMTSMVVEPIFNNIVESLENPESTPEPVDANEVLRQEMEELFEAQRILRAITGVFSSATISTSGTEDGGYVFRMALSLAEAAQTR